MHAIMYQITFPFWRASFQGRISARKNVQIFTLVFHPTAPLFGKTTLWLQFWVIFWKRKKKKKRVELEIVYRFGDSLAVCKAGTFPYLLLPDLSVWMWLLFPKSHYLWIALCWPIQGSLGNYDWWLSD